MTTPNARNDLTILTHAVLIGLTPLIPIPFVDDAAQSYLQQRMVQDLARQHGLAIAPQVVSILLEGREGCVGSAGGCLAEMVLYPIKKISRKVLYFLEWHRAVNLVTHAYYYGFLLDVALQAGWLSTNTPETAARVRGAIERTRHGANTRLLQMVVANAFRESSGRIKETAGTLAEGLKSLTRRSSAQEVGSAFEKQNRQVERSLGGIVAQLRDGVLALPAEHFERLQKQFYEEYARVETTGGDGGLADRG